jgi:hypothetical protein
VVIGGVIASMLLNNLIPGPLDSSMTTLDNPYGVGALAGPVSGIIDGLMLVFMLISFSLPLVSLVWRIRRSSGLQKQQFKWFVYAAFLMAITSPAAGSNLLIVQFFFIAAMFFLPVAIAIAILRYRLFDIDLIVRRTLVYTLVSAVLGLIYFGSVLLIQEIIRSLTGQSGESQAAIVFSTLVIAALFTPLRKRIQSGIDRRFYRRKYDAERILQAFAGAVRDEVDLEQLKSRLLEVTKETMQPESVSLWLRDTGKPALRNDGMPFE